MLMDLKGVGEEEYLQVHRRLGLDEPIDGLILHTAGPIPGAWRIFDIWESEGAFQRFAQERIGPAAQEAGLDLKPNPQFCELENVWTPGAAELGRMGESPLPAGVRA